MSFAQYKSKIEEGDNVVIFAGYDLMLNVKVEKNRIHQTRYGALRHNDLIGSTYGRKVNCSLGWVHVLHPTPELWTHVLPHRTQILYSTDISLVTLELDLQPGSIVVESGTGSGSLSHAIIRTIAPSGHLYTFDFHEQRVNKAKEEFEDHGVGACVTVAQRDVCKDGFGLENIADAVFLDLPNPTETLLAARKALKKTGTARLCSFSPCIEQVQKACEKLRELGFIEISVMECLLRPLEVRTIGVSVVDLGTSGESAGDSSSEEKQTVSNVSSSLEDKDSSKNLLTEERLTPKNEEEDMQDAAKKRNNTSDVFKAASPPSQMPGHTGYLTFATLPPTNL